MLNPELLGLPSILNTSHTHYTCTWATGQAALSVLYLCNPINRNRIPLTLWASQLQLHIKKTVLMKTPFRPAENPPQGQFHFGPVIQHYYFILITYALK
jgi:hypothetical protein